MDLGGDDFRGGGATGASAGEDEGVDDNRPAAGHLHGHLPDNVGHAVRRARVHGRRHHHRQDLGPETGHQVQMRANRAGLGAGQPCLPDGPRPSPHVQRERGLPALHRGCMPPLLAFRPLHRPSPRRLNRPRHQGSTMPEFILLT